MNDKYICIKEIYETTEDIENNPYGIFINQGDILIFIKISENNNVYGFKFKQLKFNDVLWTLTYEELLNLIQLNKYRENKLNKILND